MTGFAIGFVFGVVTAFVGSAIIALLMVARARDLGA